VEPEAIRGRLDLVEALAGDVGLRDAVRDGLRGEWVHDSGHALSLGIGCWRCWQAWDRSGMWA
jgi:hypothetical protein